MQGSTVTLGLGHASGPASVSLADARKAVAAMRAKVAAGVDPLDARKAVAATAQAEAARLTSFRDVAESYLEANANTWRNHLALILPKPKKLSRGHHKALPYQEMPTFIDRLRQRQAVAAMALEFTILTAVHGFRSVFRDWVAECTAFDRDSAEMALAHSISNATESAYRRGDMFEKRRAMMAAWQSYCEGSAATGGDNVRPIQRLTA